MVSGKLTKPSVAETVAEGINSKRLHVQDRLSGRIFLVDSGAEVSVLPACSSVRQNPTSCKLFAAYDSPIDTFGECFCMLDLGLKRQISWNCIIAAVPHAILGADILHHYGLTVDLRTRRLVDSITALYSVGKVKYPNALKIHSVASSFGYAQLLAEFPEITGSISPDVRYTPDIFHHIFTTGPPVSQRPRRLNKENLAAAKAEFEAWQKAGICRPSSSQWATPLHMALKKDGSYRPCGAYTGLNAITVPDKYPTAHLYDCSNVLDGKKVFTSLDLLKAFNQIPIAPEDIEKTAIITPFGLFEFLYMTFGRIATLKHGVKPAWIASRLKFQDMSSWFLSNSSLPMAALTMSTLT